MSDLTLKLLDLINKNKSVNEISKELNLSNKQIFNIITILKNKGIECNRKYYENGDIIYNIKKELKNIEDSFDIITDSKSATFSAIIISDLHIGNSAQRIDLLNQIYDYCAKEDIHIIFICGDLIDGTYSRMPQIIDNTQEQIDFILKNYPFDKQILNFAILGDHDYSVINQSGQNLASALNNYRHDIISLGYQVGKINIKNDQIILAHKFNNIASKNAQIDFNIPDQNSLILNGHFHNTFSLKKIESNCIVNIPSLSDIRDKTKEVFPSAIKMKLSFHSNSNFASVVFNQLLIDSKIFSINEIYLTLRSSKKNNHKNTEDLSTKVKKIK